MPDGATPTDHKTAITKLFRGVKRIAAATGNRVELLLIAHVTSPDSQHYDVVAYSDAAPKRVRRIVRRAWVLAGGRSYSLRPVKSAGERARVARYASKDTSNPYVYLPASNGLNVDRYTSGFWDQTSKDQLWTECKEAWFGDRAGVVSNKDKPLYDTRPSDTLEALRPALTAPQTETTIRDKAVRLIRDFAPTTPDAAISPAALSRRVSVHPEWFSRRQSNVPGLERTSDGKLWVRLPWDRTPYHGTVRVGPRGSGINVIDAEPEPPPQAPTSPGNANRPPKGQEGGTIGDEVPLAV